MGCDLIANVEQWAYAGYGLFDCGDGSGEINSGVQTLEGRHEMCSIDRSKLSPLNSVRIQLLALVHTFNC